MADLLDIRALTVAGLVFIAVLFVAWLLKKYQITRLHSKRALIPYITLSPGFKRSYLFKLWPGDKMQGGYWRHKVTYNHETLWTISQLYTGIVVVSPRKNMVL